MTKGDVNADGLIDIFIGGAKGQAGSLFLQMKDHTFKKLVTPNLDADAIHEDMDAALFDADGDTDLDLYVVSGGYEVEESSPLLQDRLYINNGKGVFTKSIGRLEQNYSNKKCVKPIDFDNDGDLDLFVGGGVVPGKFPYASPSKIYLNDGKGNFSIIKPANAQLGMVNDVLWIDLDQDGKKDLIVASEWMPLKAYRAQGELFVDVSRQWFPFASNGWWNCIVQGDFDKDGDIDLVVGNYGYNSQLKANESQPMQLYYSDLDGNGSVDPIITHYMNNESVPLALRDDFIGQLPMQKKKFNDYSLYAKAGIKDIFTADQKEKSPVLTTNELATVYLENTGKSFVKKELPTETQGSPIHAIAVLDINSDGNLDLVMAGNNSANRIYLGRQDANHGLVLLGNGKGNFSYLSQQKSGINVKGDVRSIISCNDQLFFGVNNAAIKNYKLKSKLKVN